MDYFYLVEVLSCSRSYHSRIVITGQAEIEKNDTPCISAYLYNYWVAIVGSCLSNRE